MSIRIAAPVLLLLLLLAPGSATGAPPELVLLAPLNHTMPFAQYQEGELTGGVMKDIGETLARRLGYKARFLTIPSKRSAISLMHGEADGLCFVMPGWIDGNFNWTRPAIPAAGVIAANSAAPVIKSLQALAGERVGTVLGYRYPEVDASLGDQLLRDDAPTVLHSLNKLMAGRSKYAIVDQMTIEYHMKQFPHAPLRIDYTYLRFKASCAFSLASKVRFADVDRAIGTMAEDGTIEAILSKYR